MATEDCESLEMGADAPILKMEDYMKIEDEDTVLNGIKDFIVAADEDAKEECIENDNDENDARFEPIVEIKCEPLDVDSFNFVEVDPAFLGESSKFQNCDSLCGDEGTPVIKKRGKKRKKAVPTFYQCTECSYTTWKPCRFKLHTRRHAGIRPYPCPYCDHASFTSTCRKKHIRTHTGEKPYKCKYCTYAAADASSLATHTRYHTGQKPYKCTFCPYACADSSSYNTHIRIHSGEKAFQCKLCPFAADQAKNLKSHMKVHRTSEGYSCNMCNFTTLKASALTAHMRIHCREEFPDLGDGMSTVRARKIYSQDVPSNDSDTQEVVFRENVGSARKSAAHNLVKSCSDPESLGDVSMGKILPKDSSGDQDNDVYLDTIGDEAVITTNQLHTNFKCILCSEGFITKSELRKHNKTHNDSKPYKCHQCPYETLYQPALKKHVEVHSGEKPYECTLCTFKTAYSSSLKKHYRMHTGERPFKCKLCSYAGTQSSGLAVHMRTHTGEKPYSCKLCSYTSTNSRNLRTHMISHSSERNFECKGCSFTCKYSTALRRHILKNHKNDDLFLTTEDD